MLKSTKSRQGGGKGKSNFQAVGNLSVTKSTQRAYEENGENVIEALQNSNIKLQLYVTVPDGSALELKKGDTLVLSFQEPGERDKDWVVGKALIANS